MMGGGRYLIVKQRVVSSVVELTFKENYNC